MVYAEIGVQLARTGLNSIDHRSVVSTPRKLALIARATATALKAPAVPAVPLSPVPAIHYLVDIVRRDRDEVEDMVPTAVPHRSFDERIEWMVDLFERLEQRGRPVR